MTANAVASPVVSIVRFGHVVMPVLALGNGASSARCIRPGGRGNIESLNGQNSLEGQASMGA